MLQSAIFHSSYVTTGNLTVIDCQFISSHSVDNGGAIRGNVENSFLTITATSFVNCTVATGMCGGGVACDRGMLDIDSSCFTKCWAPDNGAAFAHNRVINQRATPSKITMTTVFLNGSPETYQDGGFYIVATESALSNVNSTRNECFEYGALCTMNTLGGTISRSTFRAGPELSVYNCNVQTFADCNFVDLVGFFWKTAYHIPQSTFDSCNFACNGTFEGTGTFTFATPCYFLHFDARAGATIIEPANAIQVDKVSLSTPRLLRAFENCYRPTIAHLSEWHRFIVQFTPLLCQ